MEKNINILIIETDLSTSAGLEEKLNHLGFQLCPLAVPSEPIDLLESLSPDLAILGPSLDKETFFKCIHKLKILDPAMPILIACDDDWLSGGSAFAPFEGLHSLSPDLDPGSISRTIEIALAHKAECELRPDLPVLIGQSREIIRIRQKIQRVADKDITVLITGETGTGKELIARSIHYHSLRNKGPLVKINCGTLPDDLLESEVFGFQKGAFTDAYRDKPGRLEMANDGTLFIDEIGDLSLSLQVKFLQVLEDKAFSRLGGTEDKIIDTRVLAATNMDLWEKVHEGVFRKDLFYRLNVVHIKAPPLRERKDDLHLLSHYFMNLYSFEFKKEPLDIPEKINDLFQAYDWPGNVREFENVIRRAIALGDWDFVFTELNLENMESRRGDGPFSDTYLPNMGWHEDRVKEFFGERDFSLKKISKAYVSEAERKAILNALKGTDWNRRKASRLLRVSYKTLLNRIDEFGLKP